MESVTKMAGSPFDLTGRTVLITGAAGLLGPEHARAVWDCGASVVMTDIDEVALGDLRNKLNGEIDQHRVHWRVMDVTSYDSVTEASRGLSAMGVRVDVLLNNAAVDPKSREDGALLRFEDFSTVEWDHQLAVGLRGAFLCSQVFGSLMAADGLGGVILNIASDLSVIAPDQRLYRRAKLSGDQQPVKPASYSVVKAGLVGLSRYLATYWADQGVRSNALSPGGVYDGQDPEFVSRVEKLIPLSRMALVSEYRSAVQFLCSDASAYMTGQNLVIDGGRSVW